MEVKLCSDVKNVWIVEKHIGGNWADERQPRKARIRPDPLGPNKPRNGQIKAFRCLRSLMDRARGATVAVDWREILSGNR